MNKREDKIQSLLRHAFYCSIDSPCTCSRNIKEFLINDRISLKWAIKEKANVLKRRDEFQRKQRVGKPATINFKG